MPEMAKRFPQPTVKRGTKVWIGRGNTLADLKSFREEALVKSSFLGKDGKRYCVLESVVKGEVKYDLVVALGLALEKDGPTFFELACKQPEVARLMLYRTGIIDENGVTRPEYGGEGLPLPEGGIPRIPG